MMWLLIIILAFCLVPRNELILAQTPDPCPTGYESGYKGQCYLFMGASEDHTTWNGAREICRQGDADSDLVVISDTDELSYMNSKTTIGIWWIGYSDLSIEKTWKWVDCNKSTPWQQSLWAANQPNNGIEDCGAFQRSTEKLADYECSRSYGFICEISPKEFTVENTNVQEVDAVSVDETTVRVTWDVSPYNCDITGYTVYYQQGKNSNINGSIQIFGGSENETVLSDLATNTMWEVYVAAVHIERGELDRVGPVEVWLGSCPEWHLPGPDNGSCYWFYHIDGGQNWWYSKRANCLDRGSDLVIIDSQEELDYILSQTETLAPGQSWWIGYTDLSVEGTWRWMDCSNTSDWQATLWAPGEPAEAEDCATLQGNTGQLSSQPCDGKFFFICEVTPKEFTIEDTNVRNVDAVAVNETTIKVTWDVSPYNCDIFGYRVYYEQYREPSNTGSVHVYGGNATEVVLYSLATHIWWEIYVAALQVEQELERVGPESVWLGTCPEWHLPGPNGSCYWFYQDVNDTGWWYSQRAACLNRGSDLLIISSQEELDYILNQTETQAPGQSWWIGYTDISTEGSWRWVDCGATNDWQSTLDIWAPGEPEELEDCATLKGDTGQLSGQTCDKKYVFICEVSQKEFTIDDTNVQSVDAVAMNETTIKVTWVVSPYNCDIFGYRVYYEQYQEPSNTGSVHVYDGNATEAILYSLTTNVLWQVYVAALQTEQELDKVGPAEVWLGVCPEWHLPGPNGSCYWFYHDVNDTGWWYDNRRACLNRDSDLAIISSQEELDYILNKTETLAPGQSWWIGYYDVSVEGMWQWVDCSDTSDWQSTLWAPGEPAEAEDCGILRGDTGQLSGEICDKKFNFICEVSQKDFATEDSKPTNIAAVAVTSSTIEVTWNVSMYACDIFGYRVHYFPTSNGGQKDSVTVYGGDVSVVLLSGLEVETEYFIGVAAMNTVEEMEQVGPVLVTTPWGCPQDFEEGPGDRSCYAFLDDYRGWGGARNRCGDVKDGDLVIIDNEEELHYVLRRMTEVNPGQTWWIGYYDISVEGVWRWVDCNPTSDWQMSLWPSDEPRVGTEDCGYVREQGNATEIRAAACDERKYIMCEVNDKGFLPEDGNARNIRASPLTPSSFEVMWDISPNNCDMIGYSIYYSKEATPSQEDFVTVYGGDVRDATIKVATVTQDTIYLASVAGLNWLSTLDRVGSARVTLTPESDHREYITVEADEGALTSPGWPSGYDNNQDITWTITVTKPGRVLLTIQSVRLDSRGDYLTIGSGSEAGSNQLERYTGFMEDAGTLESESNQMWMRLITDAAIIASGFSVQFERLEGDEGSDCGAAFIDLPSGIITSPNFPEPYPKNANCVWLIKLRDKTARVQLNFTTFDLERDHDFLILGHGPAENENTLRWLTGQIEAPSAESPTRDMWLRFISDETVSSQGFRAIFSSRAGDPPTTPVYETADTVVFIVFNQNVGWFSSINQVQLASTIAEVLNRYNILAQLGSRQQGVFDASDVVFIRFYNVDDNLHIDTWVRDATSSNPKMPLDPTTVLDAISAESEYFQNAMGPSFDYNIQLPATPTPGSTPAPGLEDWVIAVISVAALILLVLMGSVICGCARRESTRKKDDRRFSDESFRPTSFAFDGTQNPAFQSDDQEEQKVTAL